MEDIKQNLVELNVLPNTIDFVTNFIMNADETIFKMANDKSQCKDYAGWSSKPLYHAQGVYTQTRTKIKTEQLVDVNK